MRQQQPAPSASPATQESSARTWGLHQHEMPPGGTLIDIATADEDAVKHATIQDDVAGGDSAAHANAQVASEVRRQRVFGQHHDT
eukprot:4768450-Heterocapsa_arctica.AAC.1